jgi:Na+/proline symporter
MIEQLTPGFLLSVIAIYFITLFVIAYLTGRNTSNANFFLANRNTPWPLIAFGMIGTSISGVTFISIPGVVGGDGLNQAFSYMQVVLGYMVGYAVIALVLMPIYYKLNLTSIYGYLEQRFGYNSYKTGAAYFLLSRSVGSAFRLYLAIVVLQYFVTSHFGLPFWATALIALTLIWLYTVRGGYSYRYLDGHFSNHLFFIGFNYYHCRYWANAEYEFWGADWAGCTERIFKNVLF